MYTIGNIIYGVPLNSEVLKAAKNHANEGADPHDLETLGFIQLYHDNASCAIGFCGVRLGQIDECSNVDLSEAVRQWTPTDEQRRQGELAVAALPEWVKTLVGAPGVWIIWSTS